MVCKYCKDKSEMFGTIKEPNENSNKQDEVISFNNCPNCGRKLRWTNPL